MYERGCAAYAGAKVHEDIGGADARLVDHAQQRVHGAWEIRDAVSGKIRSVVRELAEPEDGIEPRVSRGGSDAKERLPKLGRVMPPSLDEPARSFRPIAVVGFHAVEFIARPLRAAPCSRLLRRPSAVAFLVPERRTVPAAVPGGEQKKAALATLGGEWATNAAPKIEHAACQSE
jgi:hypothetical protein